MSDEEHPLNGDIPEEREERDETEIDDIDDGNPPDLELLWKRGKTLFQASTEVLPFIFLAACALWMTPTIMKLYLGIDPLTLWEIDWVVELMGVPFRILAIAVLTASFPMARQYLLDDEGGPTTFGSGLDCLAQDLPRAFPVAVSYCLLVAVGLGLCLLPGLFAAAYLAPALYLATARGIPLVSSLRQAPQKVSDHSNLFVVVYGGFVAFLTVLTLSIGTTVASRGVTGVERIDFAQLATNPVVATVAIAAFVVTTAFFYCAYIALAATFVTIDDYEN